MRDGRGMGEGVFICETVRAHAHLNVRVGARAKMRVACPRRRRHRRTLRRASLETPFYAEADAGPRDSPLEHPMGLSS
eukprot:COSAG02_NODE_256_length_26885_cov_54.604308_12_plen_78_part_00